jgi:predicted RNase H-like HicB family nuclease
MSFSTYSFRVVWSDDDNAFVAICPEFEGVSGLGETAADALSEAQVALELMVETYEQERWPLPAPTNLQAYSGQFRLRVPRTLHARLAEAAADEGVSLNTYAVGLLSEGVGEARAVKHVQRCMDDLALRIRGDLFGGFLAQPNLTSAFAPYLPTNALEVQAGKATTGGNVWPS